MMQNQEGLWKSNDMWNFTFKEDLICIENINKTGEFFLNKSCKKATRVCKFKKKFQIKIKNGN